MAARAANAVESVDATPATPARAIVDYGSLSARTLASLVKREGRLDFARAVVFSVVSAYWKELQSASGRSWSLRELPPDVVLSSVPEETGALAESIGTAAAGLDVMDAGYMIGVLYTGMMPGRFRTQSGAYYTPPALCERRLDMATKAGVDWRSARVLDLACGGGAFLSPVARRMAEGLKDCSAKVALKNIQGRLNGFELDPFAAWLSLVFLDVTLGDLCREAGTRLQSVVRVCDGLEQTPVGEGFDLVAGNPPSGMAFVRLVQVGAGSYRGAPPGRRCRAGAVVGLDASLMGKGRKEAQREQAATVEVKVRADERGALDEQQGGGQ